MAEEITYPFTKKGEDKFAGYIVARNENQFEVYTQGGEAPQTRKQLEALGDAIIEILDKTRGDAIKKADDQKAAEKASEVNPSDDATSKAPNKPADSVSEDKRTNTRTEAKTPQKAGDLSDTGHTAASHGNRKNKK